ncbi:hypothetical protein ACNQFZ_06645 [Schinkia sp. CFF1]
MQEEGTTITQTETGTDATTSGTSDTSTTSGSEVVGQETQTGNVQASEGTVLDVKEIRTETVFETAQGTIHLIHEMTLGDVVVSMFLMFILIFHILDRFIRR